MRGSDLANREGVVIPPHTSSLHDPRHLTAPPLPRPSSLSSRMARHGWLCVGLILTLLITTCIANDTDNDDADDVLEDYQTHTVDDADVSYEFDEAMGEGHDDIGTNLASDDEV